MPGLRARASLGTILLTLLAFLGTLRHCSSTVQAAWTAEAPGHLRECRASTAEGRPRSQALSHACLQDCLIWTRTP